MMTKIVKAKYIALTLLGVWVLSMIYMSFSMTANQDAKNFQLKEDLLTRALSEIDRLKQTNRELTEYIEKTRQNVNDHNVNVVLDRSTNHPVEKSIKIVRALKPSKEHEMCARQVKNDVDELWYYIRDQFQKLKTEFHNSEKVEKIRKNLFQYYSVIVNDLKSLGEADAADAWRLKESKELGQLVQKVIHKLQNPKDCSTSRLLVCNLNKGCGFGCQVHHVVYCMIMSMGSNRTFVLNAKSWRYLNDGWGKFFIPPSTACDAVNYGEPPFWKGEEDTTRVIQLPIIDTLNPRPNYLPLSIPTQLSERLKRLHGDPFVWWVGQLMKYLMRPQPTFQMDIDDVAKDLGFDEGEVTVGVHIRRTDKVATEAAFHSLDEYMAHVDTYFDVLDTIAAYPKKRSIYLATDEPSVFQEVAQKYPNYKVIGNKDFSQSASLRSRYTEASLRAVILDVHFLSRCKYLVCTFSSQVCRMAYELMQTMHGDASKFFTSLDDIYYFGGQLGHSQLARLPHSPEEPNEISFRSGDRIGVAGNHWNGFSMGTKLGTPERGLYPSFKTLEVVSEADFPIFNEFKDEIEDDDMREGGEDRRKNDANSLEGKEMRSANIHDSNNVQIKPMINSHNVPPLEAMQNA
ncbi:hypothetical protein HELRODRAFT_194786 [Helobdella robusta]|uniref:GT23 domain-containing protein n=1 Tax=Helobdella robusta TaxID=6412 RepID=T1FWE8_HELRO|nr:hypothetical protein HELRODRAFT_194786 [Helobdella robusta]ESN89823.1 hypothetical protein HELRODRAFT_194786 [Helobdella robusta]